MLKEVKKFELQKNGTLMIEVDTTNELSIPHEKKSIRIGHMKQKTHQYVDKDKINILKSFIKNQKDSIEGQLSNLENELARLKELKEDIVPEKILNDAKKYLEKYFKKGNKKGELNEALVALNNNLGKIIKKKQIKQQIEFLEKQNKLIKTDWDALKKSLVL